jgi:hypothetical protein
LGGLVVKQALVTAKLNDAYGNLSKCTRGLIFFGTPHRGGNGATVAKHASRALSIFTGQPASTLLPVLEKRSFFSESLTEHFYLLSNDLKVLSFFEQRKKAVRIKRMRVLTSVSQMVYRMSPSIIVINTSRSISSTAIPLGCSLKDHTHQKPLLG